MVNIRPWPFREPRDRSVFTTRQVLTGECPILCIMHERGVLGWRFLDLRKMEVENVMFLALEDMVEILEPDILELAIELPLYSCARRASVNDPWIREYWDGRSSGKAASGGRLRMRRRKKDSS